MIADKIYLPKEEVESRMPWIAQPYEEDPNWDECYIRKEALLEWARGEAKHYFDMSVEKLIDKINSM